jgi:Cdc6-like AAA superfamily ATPase
MGENKIMFKPYNKEELKTIINNKFGHTFSEEAINLTFIKVATINGDIRRVFKILEKLRK